MTPRYASITSRVHIETPIVKDILRLPIKRAETVAKLVGCSRDYVYMIRALKKSRAHIFLPPETIRVMNENER